MKIQWSVDPTRQPICDEQMARNVYTRCELPSDHIVNFPDGLRKLDQHWGRNKTGAWMEWT
jgi:hypothetical protein